MKLTTKENFIIAYGQLHSIFVTYSINLSLFRLTFLRVYLLCHLRSSSLYMCIFLSVFFVFIFSLDILSSLHTQNPVRAVLYRRTVLP
jgi:hypothetical protein